MTIICLSGKRRSGKSTLAQLLWQEAGFHPLSLATPLKNLVMREFGMSADQVDGDKKEVIDARYGKTPRQILIEVGQFFRGFDKDWWINKLLFEMFVLGRENYVIPDVRFINELEAFKPYGAYCVRLERDEQYTGPNIKDQSETELDNFKDWDFLVPASHNVDLKDLMQAADRIKTGVLARR